MRVYSKIPFGCATFLVWGFTTLVVCVWNLWACGVLFRLSHCSPHTIGTKLFYVSLHAIMCGDSLLSTSVKIFFLLLVWARWDPWTSYFQKKKQTCNSVKTNCIQQDNNKHNLSDLCNYYAGESTRLSLKWAINARSYFPQLLLSWGLQTGHFCLMKQGSSLSFNALLWL